VSHRSGRPKKPDYYLTGFHLWHFTNFFHSFLIIFYCKGPTDVEVGIIWTINLWCINSETIWRMCRRCLEIDSDHNVLVADICPRSKKITRFQEEKARWNLEKLYAQWEKVQDILEQCFPNIFARGSLLASKNNSESSHPWSRNCCPDDRYPELKIYVLEQILYCCEYMPVTYVTMYCVIWP